MNKKLRNVSETSSIYTINNIRYLKANDLTNELEVKKDKLIEEHQIKRDKLIQEGINKIHQIQKEEKKEFDNKIKKLREAFYTKHFKKYNQAERELIDKMKEFDDTKQIENENFDRIINETKKQGIYLSPQMQEQTLKYIEYTKQKKYGYLEDERYNSSLNI